MYANNHVYNNRGAFLGEEVNHGHQPQPRRVYLEGSDFYAGDKNNRITKVAPAPNGFPPPLPIQQFPNGVVFEFMKPMIYLLRAMGIHPIGPVEKKTFKMTVPLMVYSGVLLLLICAYIGYLKWSMVEVVRSTEAKFEEAVIDYLFTVYLFPVVLVPITWYESRKVAGVFNDWRRFENVYKRLTDRVLPLFMGNKPLVVTIALPVISCATMIVNHMTMVNFRILQVIPYCYINTVTYLIGGVWYLNCEVIGRVATLIASDFQKALLHIGPSQMVAEYRSLWMLLAKITRSIGMANCYAVTFLNLYLFLIITLTIYGLLSQIQAGLGIKDVGLTITAFLAIILLYFICDEAHYASNCVKVLFQKKLLLVELSWMNEDAQQEIQMFLRATEMSETNISLGGFFDVNRGLFKSLLATMVTYLVVLLQFQISLPEGNDEEFAFSTIASVLSTTS